MAHIGRLHSNLLTRLSIDSTLQWGICRIPLSQQYRLVEKSVACSFTSSVTSPSSASASEIAKFSKLSRIWWNPKRNPLIAMNPVRVKYIVDYLSQRRKDLSPSEAERQGPHPLKGFSALDVGCGGGVLAESLARLGAKVTAIDPSTTLVQMARRHSQIHPLTREIDYREGWTVEQLADECHDSSIQTRFDIICLSEVLEHVKDVESVLTAVASLLKNPDGCLFVSTLNRTVKSKVLAILGAEYVMGFVPVGTHDWEQFKSPKEVQELMERVRLTQLDVSGMVLAAPPLFGEWDWSLKADDTDLNWIGVYAHE